MIDSLIKDVDVHLQSSPSNRRHLQAVDYLLNVTYDLLKYDNQSGVINTTIWMNTSYPFFYNITKVGFKYLLLVYIKTFNHKHEKKMYERKMKEKKEKISYKRRNS